MKHYKAQNKRIIMRSDGGRFCRTTFADFGIGICPNKGCNHLTVEVYDGDPNDPMPDPRKFRQRCYHCEPETEAELEAKRAREAALKSQKSGFVRMLEDAAVSVDAS